MKKLLLATAIAALSVSAANAAPTIYGKAFITADYVNGEFDGTADIGNNDPDLDANSVQINSNGSRIGFKGSEPMTANTDVIYQLEYGTSVDGDGDSFKNRDTYLGVANDSFGELRFGKNQTVTDYINNVTVTEGYWDNLGTNKLDENKDVDALNMADSERRNSSIVWMAPKYNNMPLEVALMYGADEGFYEDSDDRDNGYGASIMFDQGTGFTVGVAYSDDLDMEGDLIRGSISFDASQMSGMPLTLGALYQQADYDGRDEEEQGFVISGELGLANFARPASIYAQYNSTTDLNGFKDADSDQFVIGGKYKYRDNMIMHAYVGANSADDITTEYVASKDINGKDVMGDITGDVDVFAIGAGLEYKF